MTRLDIPETGSLFDDDEPLRPARLAIREELGRGVSTRTVQRWTRAPGLRGAVLESALIGACRSTTRSAVRRFAAAVAAAGDRA